MIEVKLFEIRDRGTLIPILATRFDGSDHVLFRVAGFDINQHAVILCKLTGGACAATYDPFDWPANPRTMREAHLTIYKADWDSLQNGQVIDVEYELGETTVSKVSESHYKKHITLGGVMWVFRQSEPNLWTVGFFTPGGKWEPESDHRTAAAAAKRVRYLNGGSDVTADDITAAAMYLER